MDKVEFSTGGSLRRTHDAVYLRPAEEPLTALVEAVIDSIGTSVMVTVGDITMHLAAWQDPDHWEEDWRAKGIAPDDVAEFVASHILTPE